MPEFTVTVGGVDYDVTAKDENQAWQYANQHVAQRAQRREALAAKYAAEDEASGATDPTHGMSWPQKAFLNLGAGADDWVLGAKQLAGRATGEEAREKKRIDDYLASKTRGGKALQFAGNVAPAVAATAFIPGAASITGGALIGGGMGALSPTEDDDIGTGKGINTVAGAVLGGAVNAALPYVSRAATKYVAPVVGRAAGAVRDAFGRFTEAGQQGIAERAFVKQFKNPLEALQALKAHATTELPGVAPTTAQILGKTHPSMLATEARLANTGGEAANELLGRRLQSNAARNEVLQGGLAKDAPALKRAASEFAEANKPKAFTSEFNHRPVMVKLDALQSATNSPLAKANLGEIGDRITEALASNNPLEQLHQVRMYQLDDALAKLAQTDRKLAGSMRGQIQQVKDVLDAEMNKATSGQWQRFLDGYAVRAQARSEGVAGNKLLEKIGEGGRDLRGNPFLRPTTLRKAANKLDRFGKPVLGDTGRKTVDDVVRSLEVEGRVAAVKPASSPTAFNQSRGSATANDALLNPLTGQVNPPGFAARVAAGAVGSGPGASLGSMVAGAPGAWVGGSVGGVAGDAVLRGAQTRALDIARKLFQMHMDPTAAIPVLEQAVKAGQLSAQQASAVMDALRKLAAQGVRTAAPAAATTSLSEILRRKNGS